LDAQEDTKRTRRPRMSRPIRWLGRGIAFVAAAPTQAIRGTARVVADPTRQVAAYWRAERSTVRQGFVSNFVSVLTSLISGLTLAGMESRLLSVKGLFVLIPVSIGMRGNIFGALSARLGSSIHSGLFEVSSRRDGPLYQNAYASTILTLATSVTMGILARAIASLVGIRTVSVWDFVAIALLGGLLSSAVVLAFTVALSIASFRRGWDLDSVGAVLVTVAGDVVTLPALFAASFIADIDVVTPIVGGTSLALGAVALARGWTFRRALVRRIVRESFPVLCLAMVLDILAGAVVEPRMEAVFTAFPAFLILIPGFLENTGALGSILAARLGTKLHLGAVSPRAMPEAPALLDGTIVLGLGVFVYALSAVTTLGVAEIAGKAHPGAVEFLAIALVGGLIAMLLAGLIGYYAAILSYRFGFDPDNHTVPLVTSGMDLLGVICLVIAFAIFGVA
jgi:mgtE-like transporter